MEPIILYTNTRHGYARITKDWVLQLSIPSHLRNNQKFYDELIWKWENLLKKYQSKNSIDTVTENSVLLFWENIDIQDVEPNKKKFPQAIKKILYDYSIWILDKYSKLIGCTYRDLKIKKVKSKRWSCTGNQIISLNLDLVHLPTRLIKYVIIHEVCHLKIKDHSIRFRKLVESFCPNYKLLRKELKNLIIK